MNFTLLKLTVAVIASIGLYSVLYRENKFYRLVEHTFLGLAMGWTLVALWTEVLKDTWWDRMVGHVPQTPGEPMTMGNWALILLLPIGLMGYFVFSKRHNWMSRIPIGIILGLWSGQQIYVWYNRYGPQIAGSIKPLLPTQAFPLTVPSTEGMTPEAAAAVAQNVYFSQALTNILFVFTLVSVLSYFLFSFDLKNRFLLNTTLMGRWLLMIGFGAIFGSTVMMRFTLLIDRMYFIWIEWLMQGVFQRF
jgi:hypothetical protein